MSASKVKIESYGVKIAVEVALPHQKQLILDRMKDVLPVKVETLAANRKTDHQFFIETGKKKKFSLFKGEEKVLGDTDEDLLLERLDSQIRLTVAEFAKDHVFVHCGVVEWKGKAIMIPASSYDGKTTSMFTCTSGFNSCIECEKICLVCYVRDYS